MDTHAPAGRALALSRYVHASPARVFAAWIEPAQVMRWWGPRGMTTPDARIEPHPGGAHRTVMRDAEGRDYVNDCVIEAIEPPRRLALRVTGGDCADLAGAIGRIAFTPEGEGTRLDISWEHPDEAMRDRHLAMGFFPGWGGMLDKLAAHVAPVDGTCPIGGAATAEHGWLQRMVGTWRFESESRMVPGQDIARGTGIERVRPLGPFWVVGESEGEMPGMGPARWIVSLGFDPRAGRFRGGFVGSMMPQPFVYDGALSADATTLTLDSEGPAMSGEGTARFRDVVELPSPEERVVTSLAEAPEGGWITIMTARFRRIG